MLRHYKNRWTRCADYAKALRAPDGQGNVSAPGPCKNSEGSREKKPEKGNKKNGFGKWLSLVEHSVRDAGVGGSNPLFPTIYDT